MLHPVWAAVIACLLIAIRAARWHSDTLAA